MSPQLESLSNKRLLHRKISKTCRQAKLRRLRRLLHFSGAYHLELFPDYMDYLHRFVRCLDYRYENTYRCKMIFSSEPQLTSMKTLPHGKAKIIFQAEIALIGHDHPSFLGCSVLSFSRYHWLQISHDVIQITVVIL